MTIDYILYNFRFEARFYETTGQNIAHLQQGEGYIEI